MENWTRRIGITRITSAMSPSLTTRSPILTLTSMMSASDWNEPDTWINTFSAPVRMTPDGRTTFLRGNGGEHSRIIDASAATRSWRNSIVTSSFWAPMSSIFETSEGSIAST